MKQTILTITENVPLTRTVYRMKLAGEVSAITAPGQFISIALDGKYLRRPISVFDLEDDTVTIIYKTVGEGTKQMAGYPAGKQLDTLTGLGNGYNLSRAGDQPLLIGGGVGVPPLYLLARCLRRQGKQVTALLGFNTADEVFAEEAFRAIGCETIVTTTDGSYGRRGFVTDALPEQYSFFYACGPEPMLKAVYRASASDGQFSFEERMGCGFGACMGCSRKTTQVYKRVCKDGPVFDKEEIVWED